MFYGTIWTWDPRLISWQILSVQAFFYFMFGILISFWDIIVGQSVSVHQIFSYLDFSKTDIPVLFAYLLNSISQSYVLLYLIERSKKCLDFAVTSHILHIIACWIYNGFFPNTFAFWIMNILSMIITSLLGEYLCQKKELEAIPMSTQRTVLV